ncbi:hypothetical protein CJ178_03870 [Rhodococcus sp. ACPA4]|nr:hypothetical protein CJ178_03870 [Rhodococcus sp. ACPA4]ROZ46011.1 hypothetical protein EEB13_17350 [Rhodococcus sp. WS3]
MWSAYETRLLGPLAVYGYALQQFQVSLGDQLPANVVPSRSAGWALSLPERALHYDRQPLHMMR